MNISKHYYLILCCITLISGALLYAYTQEWIIIRWPRSGTTLQQELLQPGTKKKVVFTYWHQQTWRHETQELVVPGSKAEAIYYLINSWLNLLEEEGLMDKKVTLQTALLTGNNNFVYLSFDRNPLPGECATYQKWMWVVGLLKTLQDNGIALQGVHFMVHHQPLHDEHLDFTNPWPMNGFLK